MSSSGEERSFSRGACTACTADDESGDLESAAGPSGTILLCTHSPEERARTVHRSVHTLPDVESLFLPGPSAYNSYRSAPIWETCWAPKRVLRPWTESRIACGRPSAGPSMLCVACAAVMRTW